MGRAWIAAAGVASGLAAAAAFATVVWNVPPSQSPGHVGNSVYSLESTYDPDPYVTFMGTQQLASSINGGNFVFPSYTGHGYTVDWSVQNQCASCSVDWLARAGWTNYSYLPTPSGWDYSVSIGTYYTP